MSTEFAVRVIESVGAAIRSGSPIAREAFGVATSCYIVGGEPCDDLSALESVTSAAKRNGFFTQLVTWGYWALRDDINDCLEAIKPATDLLMISVSSRLVREHGVDHIDALVRAAREREIPCSMQLTLDDGDRWPLDLVALPILSQESLIIQVVPWLNEPRPLPSGSGRVLNELPPFRCRDLFGLIVGPNGDVFPCSPMIGVPHMRLGNLATDPVDEVLRTALGRSDLCHLADQGPARLRELAQESGKAASVPTEFVDACDFHRQFVSKSELADVAARWQFEVSRTASRT